MLGHGDMTGTAQALGGESTSTQAASSLGSQGEKEQPDAPNLSSSSPPLPALQF